MQINTRKDGLAQFTLTKQEFRCLDQARKLLLAMSRHLPEVAFDFLASGSTAIKQIQQDLTEPKTVDEEPPFVPDK